MLEQGALKVTVVRGVGLLAADKGGTSDPYVVVQLGKTKKRSKVIKKTLDPEWNEALTFDGIGMRELVESQLLVRAFDYDGITSRNDTLGARRVSVELLHTVAHRYIPLRTVIYCYTPLHTVSYRHMPSHTVTYSVTRRYTPLHAVTGELSVGLDRLGTVDRVDYSQPLSIQGSVQFTAEWLPSTPRAPRLGLSQSGAGVEAGAPLEGSVPQDAAARRAERGALKVHLARGVGLLAADKGGTSDPYVVVQLGKTKHSSKVIKKTLDPEWDEAVVFSNLTLEQVLTTELILNAKDQDAYTLKRRNDSLGELSVRLEALHTVTYRHLPSPAVTCRHLPSHTVTCRHVPFYTVTYRYIPLHTVFIPSRPRGVARLPRVT